ncbi:MAG: ATPase, T2SS/T4P/T4SS family [Planctomycetota bacterium]
MESNSAITNARLPNGVPIWELFVRRVPIAYARRHGVLGVLDDGGCPNLAITDETTKEAIDAVRRRVAPVGTTVWKRSTLERALESGYAQQKASTTEAIAQVDKPRADEFATSATRMADLLDAEGKAPVVKLVNAMLHEAIAAEASDVHVQPREGKTLVRLRCDGVLFDAFEFNASVHDELVSRVKIMGEMDIAEKRIPQDGRATVQLGPRSVDLRLSSVPTQHGERLALRLLDHSARRYKLHELGMPDSIRRKFAPLIRAEHGLVLVTGPTGSGKSTTLYGALKQINAEQLNVLTLEDPIEYQLENVSQMQVASRRGISFANGLRSVLRQDPDIIMVGEIRDRETAELAIQAALTGHLVLSTLHTNDASSAVTRLIDLGVEPYLVASSLLGVMAQRLVRRVCASCAQPIEKREEAELEFARLGSPWPAGANPHRGAGCASCRGTGYRHRMGLFELLTIDESFSDLISRRASSSELRRHAIEAGLTTLAQDGLNKVATGLTTAEEVLRVTRQVVDSDTSQENVVVDSETGGA